jgi:hypothetical protein
MSQDYRRIIEQAFPPNTWPIIIALVNQGYAIVDQMILDTPWLNWPVGKDQRGHLQRVVVMDLLRNACEEGLLSAVCTIGKNTQRNCHQISLKSGPLLLHVARVPHESAFPRDTRLRDEHRVSNMILPFPELKEDIERERLVGLRRYGWLTFGESPAGDFVCIGIPASHQNVWLQRLNITIESRGMIMPTFEDIAPAVEPTIKLKQEILDRVRRGPQLKPEIIEALDDEHKLKEEQGEDGSKM